MTRRTMVASAFGTILAVAESDSEARARDEKNAPLELSLTIQTDRNRYDSDDTILFLATFRGNGRAQVQFSDGGAGSLYFYLVYHPHDDKARTVCSPIWERQLKPWTQKRADVPKWLTKVSTGISRQLAVYQPPLLGVQPGKYVMRIGYTLQEGERLSELIKKATGQELHVEAAASLLPGAWNGELLSEPVTITIGPEKKKP